MRARQQPTVAFSHAIVGMPPFQMMTLALLVVAMIGWRLGTVSAVASPVSVPVASVAATKPADPFAASIAEAARRFDLRPKWIRAVMRVESAGDVRAMSSAGAMGLMQIMPQTWDHLRVRHRLGIDPFDPHDNILAGAAYLREMLDRYGSPGFLAAYNAGPGRYEEHLKTGRALPAETRAYVAAIAPSIGEGRINDAGTLASTPQSWAQAPLFIDQVKTIFSTGRPLIVLQPKRKLTAQTSADHSSITSPSDSLFIRRAISANR